MKRLYRLLALRLKTIVNMSFRGPIASLLVFLIASQAQAMSCWAAFSPHFKSIVLIDTVLRTQDVSHYDIHSEQTIFYSGRLDPDGRMSFQAPGGLKKWDSIFQAVANSDTIHGDLRNPVFIFGPELSRFFGWEFRILDAKLGLNGPMTMHAPGSRLYEKRILQVNELLIAEGKEPIAIIPRQAGFLSAPEMLKFSITTPKEEIEMSFPNEDRNPTLTPHEAAYHLNLIFPRELLRRARNITTLVSDFALRLRKTGDLQLGLYANGIVNARALEIDVASGKTTTLLAAYRGITKFNKPTAETSRQRIEEGAVQGLAREIETWSRPTLTPFEVLIQVLIMYDKSFSRFLQIQKPDWMANLVEQNDFTEAQRQGYVEAPMFSATPEIHMRILNLLIEYREAHKPLLRPPMKPRRGAQWWADHILTTLDQRVDEITSALKRVLEGESPR